MPLEYGPPYPLYWLPDNRVVLYTTHGSRYTLQTLDRHLHFPCDINDATLSISHENERVQPSFLPWKRRLRQRKKETETDRDSLDRAPLSDREEGGRRPRHTYQEIAAATNVIIPTISFGRVLLLGSWKAFARLIPHRR